MVYLCASGQKMCTSGVIKILNVGDLVADLIVRTMQSFKWPTLQATPYFVRVHFEAFLHLKIQLR